MDRLAKPEGILNFRDLGGLRARQGRTVRPRTLYRSAALSEATQRDLALIADLGIALVCDLRSDHERAKAPSRWPIVDEAQVIALNVDTDIRGDTRDNWSKLFADFNPHGARAAMVEAYRSMPGAMASGLPRFLRRVLDANGLPALIHCSAGKDRTGFLCATLLLAVGVEREEVYRDYLRSTDLHATPERVAAACRELAARTGNTPDAETMLMLLTVREEYLDAALDVVEAEYHSPDRYLREAGGMNDKDLERLAAMLLA